MLTLRRVNKLNPQTALGVHQFTAVNQNQGRKARDWVKSGTQFVLPSESGPFVFSEVFGPDATPRD